MKVGKDSVVIGRVSPNLEVGEGCVIIGATDERGNTIINTPMAVGRGAQAGPSSIAIGAYAGAGAAAGINHQHIAQQLQASLQEFASLVAQQQHLALTKEFEKLKQELAKPTPDKSLVLSAWDGVKAIGTINGAHTLLLKVSTALAAYFGVPSA